MIQILEKYTDKYPLQHIGEVAGICWNSPIDDKEKNIKRAKSCISSGHTRTCEYPDVELVISGYSARCIRELYTHIIGTTRLQESTRYVDMKDFGYFTPPKILADEKSNEIYTEGMEAIKDAYVKMEENGIVKEDSANILPLGMDTKIVLKINLRALMHFMEMRLCNRAYHEIRKLSLDIKKALSEYSEEWKIIADTYFVPKCEIAGYCTEAQCCGRKPKRKDVVIITKEEYDRLKGNC